MSQTISKTYGSDKTVRIRSTTENVVFSVGSGKHLILPTETDFSNCETALNSSIDLSGKQDTNAKLTQLSSLSGSENQVVAFDGSGELVAVNQVSLPSYDAPLSVSAGVVSLDETGFLKSSDLGVSVQAYSANILQSADIGVSVQGFDNTILNSGSIGSSVQAFHQHLTDLSNTTPSNNQVLKFDGDNWVASVVSVDDSNYAKLDSNNSFAGVIQQQNTGETSESYTKIFDTQQVDLTEFSMLSVPSPVGGALYATVNVIAVAHNGATCKYTKTAHVCNSNQNLSQSTEIDGNSGLYDITLDKCSFDIVSNNLRLRIKGVDGLTIKYHAHLHLDYVVNPTV
jgi:hypothetical protein